MAAVLRVKVFQNEVDKLLRGRSGPVVLHQANLGRRTAAIARRMAPRGKGPGPHLADNIDSKLVPSGRGGYNVVITAGVPWAIYVHRGTRPHDIGSPVYIYGVGWRYIGRSPAGKGKPHPGTKPNPFMLRAMAAAGLRGREVR